MCTSIVSNGKKTIIGWNLDLLDMEYQVVAEDDKVYIAIMDEKEGWLPLFGANARGDFVAMPTCWPFDERSNPVNTNSNNLLMLDMDLLLCKKHWMKSKRSLRRSLSAVFRASHFRHSYQTKQEMFYKSFPDKGYAI